MIRGLWDSEVILNKSERSRLLFSSTLNKIQVRGTKMVLLRRAKLNCLNVLLVQRDLGLTFWHHRCDGSCLLFERSQERTYICWFSGVKQGKRITRFLTLSQCENAAESRSGFSGRPSTCGQYHTGPVRGLSGARPPRPPWVTTYTTAAPPLICCSGFHNTSTQARVFLSH